MKAFEIEALISSLSSDRRLTAECPHCSASFPLAKAGLFYGNKLTPEANDYVLDRRLSFEETARGLEHRKLRATDYAARKSLEVNFGKSLEKVAPVLPGFPYDCGDCRPLFDPIDYVVFRGLTSRNEVDEICFLDVKTGSSQLNAHQKEVKEAVEKGKVEFWRY